MRLDQAGFALSLALGALLAPAFAYAQWQPDGIPVAALNGNQHRPVSAPDGAGGVYLAWFDDRGPYGRQIYAQRLSASGVPAWETHGIKVRNLPGTNWELAIAADGQGGAILAWYTSPDSTQDNILAQRLDGAGNCLWDTNGVAVCSEPRRQIDPAIVSDGAGGAIIAWRDERNSFDGDVYAQRMSAAGARMWNPAGVAICVATDQQLGLAIVASGDGGAIVAWEDYRGIDTDIYAQRVDASGAVEWMPDGVPACRAVGYQFEVVATEDGANGTVLAWSDSRSSPDYAIYAQRLSSAGAALWDTSAVAMVVPPTSASYPCVVSDGAGGAIVAWEAFSASQIFVKVQRVSASGAVLFGTTGVRLSNGPGSENNVCIASDGVGGAVVSWTDSRLSTNNTDIYAQRVNAEGVLKWEAEGRAVCTAASVQNFHTLAPGPLGSAILAWSDFRTGAYDVYAGSPDSTSVSVVSVGWERPVTGRIGHLRPNPTRAGAALDFELTTSQRVSIEVLDVNGRVVRRIVKGQAFAAGSQTVFWDGTSDRGAPVSAGVYNIRVSGSDFAATRRVAVVR